MIQRYDSLQQFDEGGPWVKHTDYLAEMAKKNKGVCGKDWHVECLCHACTEIGAVPSCHTCDLENELERAEAQVGALKERIELFANELGALDAGECAKQLRDEVLGGVVNAPTYSALKAQVERLKHELRQFGFAPPVAEARDKEEE